MNLSRRDFIHGGCAAGIATLGPSIFDRAEAWTHGSALGVQGKAQVNLNISANEVDFPFLNMVKLGGSFAPAGGMPTADPWALMNSDGYPTAMCPGAAAWRSNTSAYYPGGESYFTGSVTGNALTVSGSVTGTPLFIGQTIRDAAGSGAVPNATRIIGGSGISWTLSNSAGSPTGSIAMTGFIPWVLEWSGNADLGGSGPQSNGITFPPPGYSVNSNRTEFWLPRLNQGAGATFTINLTAGSTSATLTNIVGTLFQGMKISGVGIPPGTVLDGGSGASWGILFPAVSVSGGTSGGGVLSYNLTNVAATGAPLVFGDAVDFSVQINSITTTPSNVCVYLQTNEADVNSGKICAPHFKNFYRQYGRLRFMNWLKTNGSSLANWADRCPQTYFCWSGLDNLLLAKYSGLCPANSNNQFVGPNTPGGIPASWADKTTVQFSVSNCPATANIIGTIDNGSGSAGNTLTVSTAVSGTLRIGLKIFAAFNGGNGQPQTCTITGGSGTSWTVDGSAQLAPSQPMVAYAVVSAFSIHNPAQVTCVAHGFSTNDIVQFPSNASSSTNSNSPNQRLNQPGGVSGTNWSNTYTITKVDADNFTLNGVDSSAWDAYGGGSVVILAPTFQCGSLTPKTVVGVAINGYSVENNYTVWQRTFNGQIPVLITGVYDSVLDVLILSLTQQSCLGMPYEAAVQIANEINGPDPWINVPAFATDDFVLQLSTYMKANLNSPLKWCFELSNEVWNLGTGFWQSYYATAVGITKWSISTPLDQWFGWRFYNMVQQVNAVYGTGKTQVTRIFSYRIDGQANGTVRATAPATGVPSAPLSSADSVCFADYVSLSVGVKALPRPEDIYNYQQGVLTGNPSLITSALNGMDAAFSAFGLGDPATVSIDNGSGGAGTTMTVTNIPTTGVPPNTNPRIGPQTVLQPFSSFTPATGTYVVQQLTIFPGDPPNKRGTYQLSQSQFAAPGTLIGGSNTGGSFDNIPNQYLPYFLGLATTYGVAEVCCYEGGYGDLPGFESAYTSYMGNPINLQDTLNLEVAYQNSSQYAASYASFLATVKAAGLKYASAYCMTAGVPNTGGMYGMVYPNIFGMVTPAKASFDAYNAS